MILKGIVVDAFCLGISSIVEQYPSGNYALLCPVSDTSSVVCIRTDDIIVVYLSLF